MGADYSFFVKSIATYAPAFLRHNNSVLARVGTYKKKDMPKHGVDNCLAMIVFKG